MTVRNRFEVLSLDDEAQESRDSEFAEKDSRDALQDGALQDKALKTKLARKKDCPPRDIHQPLQTVSVGLRAEGDNLGELLGGRT